MLCLQALLGTLRECVTVAAFRVCRCDRATCSSSDCLIAVAQAFVWCGGIDYMLPALLRSNESAVHAVCFQLVALLPQLQAQVDNALSAGACVRASASLGAAVQLVSEVWHYVSHMNFLHAIRFSIFIYSGCSDCRLLVRFSTIRRLWSGRHRACRTALWLLYRPTASPIQRHYRHRSRLRRTIFSGRCFHRRHRRRHRVCRHRRRRRRNINSMIPSVHRFRRSL